MKAWWIALGCVALLPVMESSTWAQRQPPESRTQRGDGERISPERAREIDRELEREKEQLKQFGTLRIENRAAFVARYRLVCSNGYEGPSTKELLPEDHAPLCYEKS